MIRECQGYKKLDWNERDETTGITTFDSHWKSIEFGKDLKRSLLVLLQCGWAFLKFKKQVFAIHGAWHSPSTLPIIVYKQAFSITIISWRALIEKALPIRPHGNVLCSSMDWELGVVTSTRKIILKGIYIANDNVLVCIRKAMKLFNFNTSCV
jgi:hypothetical protein